MKRGLNFNHALIIVFLAFVSLWAKADEFDLELDDGTPPVKMNSKNNAKKSTSPTSAQAGARPPVKSAPTPAVVLQAQALYDKGEFEKVTGLLWKDVDKIDRNGFILLAKAHEKRNEPGDMARAMNILIGKDPKDFEAQTYLGLALMQQKRNNEAMEAFKHALEMNPKFEPAYNGLVKMYEKRNPPNLYELRILYQDMIDNIGRRPQYLNKLCDINTQDSVFEIARENCKEAIQKDPANAANFTNMAICLKATGNEDGSIDTLKKAAVKFPKAEVAQYAYAKVLEEQKNYIDAMKFYKAATEANPESGKAWLGLATTSFEIRKFDVSLIAYKNACKYDRKNASLFRKATTVLRNSRNSEWSGKFESASENCTF